MHVDHVITLDCKNLVGRYLTVDWYFANHPNRERRSLTLCEVEIFAHGNYLCDVIIREALYNNGGTAVWGGQCGEMVHCVAVRRIVDNTCYHGVSQGGCAVKFILFRF